MNLKPQGQSNSKTKKRRLFKKAENGEGKPSGANSRRKQRGKKKRKDKKTVKTKSKKIAYVFLCTNLTKLKKECF